MKKIVIILITILSLMACTNSRVLNKKSYLKKVSNGYNINDRRVDSYNKHDAVILYSKDKITVEENYFYEIESRRAKKILTYNGKKDNSELKIEYDSRYEEVEIKEAFTIKKDGTRVDISKDDIKILDSSDDYLYQEFAVKKIVILPFKMVEIGDVVEFVYIKRNKKGDRFSRGRYFKNYYPMLFYEYEIVYKKNMNLNLKKANWNKTVVETKYSDGENIVYRFSSENINPLMEEDYMPRGVDLFPTLYITTYIEWGGFLEEINEVSKKHLEVSNSVKELADKITDKNMSDFKKVEEVKNYIAKNIRYINSSTLFEFEPRSMNEVIVSSYGTSFEKGILFNQIMNYFGIKNRMVVLGPCEYYFDLEKEYILTDVFDYVVNEVTLNDEVYYVDTYNEFYKLKEFVFNDMVAIPIQDNLEFIVVNGKKKSFIKKSYKCELDEDGVVDVLVENEYSGENAASFRKKYQYMTDIEKKLDFREVLGKISLETEALSEGYKIDLGANPTKSYSYREKNFSTRTGEFVYFDIPMSLDIVDLTYLPNERQYPVELVSDYDYRVEYEISLPEGYKVVEMPSSIELKNRVVDIKRVVDFDKGKLTIKDSIKLRTGKVKLEDYKKLFNELYKLSLKENRRVLLLKK